MEVVPVKTTPQSPPSTSTSSSSSELAIEAGDGAAPAVGPQGPGEQPESPAAPALKPGGAQDPDDATKSPGMTEEPAGEDKWEPLPSVTTETPRDNVTTTPADGLKNMAELEKELLEMQYRDGKSDGDHPNQLLA